MILGPWRRVALAILALTLGLGGRAGAQGRTGLVLLGPPEVEARAGQALASVTWPHGPRRFVAVSGAGPVDWVAVRREADLPGLASAVVVPLVPLALAAERGRVSEAWPWPVRISEPVADGDRAVVALARDIERRAAGELGALAERLAREPAQLTELTVTASRAERTAFEAPMGVTALGAETIRRRAPQNPADLFRDLPGLDVDGVGASQHRFVIRGLYGQRVLLLEDGLRVNNARREQGVDEPPAMFPVDELARIEVVRGATSVLYGSDAVGGVVNLIGLEPPTGRTGTSAFNARLGYQHRSADRLDQAFGSAFGTVGRFGFRASGTYRQAGSYLAPAGRFGNVTVARPAPVHDTGVEDHRLSLAATYALGAGHQLAFKAQRYRAGDAGLGYMAPADLGLTGATVQLLYPDRTFQRAALTYRGTAIRSVVADRIDATWYVQGNNRSLVSNVTQALSGGRTLQSRSENVTDVSSVGLRLEARKALRAGHLVTWGIDAYRDASHNTDTATTVVSGASGPISATGRGRPQVPYANLRSVGLFAQAEVVAGRRATLTLGARLQDVRAASEATPRITEPLFSRSDRSVVGAASLLYRVAGGLNLVAGAGRAFRSPNLVERFFTGVSPEGSTYWRYNPSLRAETSLDLQLGLRFLSRAARVEAYAFRNAIHDGIRRVATGDSVNGLPEVRYENVDALRYSGIEMTADVDLLPGLSVLGHYTRAWTTNVGSPSLPLGDSYASKIVGALRYGAPSGRWWAEYQTRHNGRRADAELGRSVVGAEIPPFTVHTARAGLTLTRRYRLGVTVDNLFDVLYAEAPNVSFFRPDPGRSVTLTATAEF